MHISIAQPHAAMDKFPQFVSTIRGGFPDDCEAVAEQIIDAELGVFCWESRFAERSISVVDDLFRDDDGTREEVRILGYFRGRYLVAICIVDAKRHLHWMPKVRQFDVLTDAEAAFLAEG